MAQNLLFDPVARDYVFQNGSPQAGGLLETCYYPLAIPQNQWLYGVAGQGSQLYTLQNVKRTASIEQLFAGYVNTAITTQVIDNQLASAVQIINLATSSTATSNQIEVTPAATPVAAQLNFNSV